MIVRDGRNQVHDLGPRRTLQISLLKLTGTSGLTGSGRLVNNDVAKGDVKRMALSKAAREHARRLANLEHCREVDRIRLRRWRARRKAALSA